MAGETPITIIGNLSADPELRYTAAGKPVANFTVASTPRMFNRQSKAWEDGETLWMRCSAWGSLAENIVESFGKGARVIASGQLKTSSWQTDTGERRSRLDLLVDEVGASVKFATVAVKRNQRSSSAGPADDPWATAPAGADASF